MSDDNGPWPTGKVGYVAIVGRPNVGKSTFLNATLGYHLAAVSSRPQTTRRRWRGILSDDESQIIFLDTPGVHEQNTQLGNFMLHAVARSLEDADVVLCICDATREPGEEDEMVIERVAAAKQPVILAVNKIDEATPTQQKEIAAAYQAGIPDVIAQFGISALQETNLDAILAMIRDKLPSGPYFYPPDQITDAFERDIGAEIIREGALQHLYEELPHALAIEIVEWKQTEKKLRIEANLYVERDAQKPLVIGKNGTMLNRIRADAVKLLREWSETFVDLNIHVKVAPKWRNKQRFLRDMGLMDG
jgi:GTP-binding protein Era